MADPAAAPGIEALAWRFLQFIGPTGSAVLGTLVLLWKLGLLKRNGNGHAVPAQGPPITGPVVIPHNSIAAQLDKGTTGDWTIHGHMLKTLGELRGELTKVSEQALRHEITITELQKAHARIEEQIKNLPVTTATLIMKELREAGILAPSLPFRDREDDDH